MPEQHWVNFRLARLPIHVEIRQTDKFLRKKNHFAYTTKTLIEWPVNIMRNVTKIGKTLPGVTSDNHGDAKWKCQWYCIPHPELHSDKNLKLYFNLARRDWTLINISYANEQKPYDVLYVVSKFLHKKYFTFY